MTVPPEYLIAWVGAHGAALVVLLSVRVLRRIVGA